jgi:endo-1,4-beta-xylanase
MTATVRARWTRRQVVKASLAAGAAVATPAWLMAAQSEPGFGVSVTGPNSLRAHAATHGLMFGAAVNPALLDVGGLAAGGSADPYTQLVVGQANILVAENAMKWAGLRPTFTTFDFALADKLMRFASLAGQRVRGHNLCWHEGLPAWFKTTVTKDNARKLLVEHIQTVAGRYRGQLHSWDVVNEAIDPKDGRPDGLRKTPWLEMVGADYIELAFQTAAAADPAAKLTYNDFDIELDSADQSVKRGQVLLLLRRLKARGVPIHAVGLQSHLKADGAQPGAGVQTFIREVAKMGLEVYVTEMDVNTHKIEGGPMVQDAAVARVFHDYLGMVLAEPNVPIVLTWGLDSAHSWLNQIKSPWTTRADGSRQRPLPFDDDLRPTPAFQSLRAAIDTALPTVQTAPQAAPGIDPGSLYKPFPVQGSPTPPPSPAPITPAGPTQN